MFSCVRLSVEQWAWCVLFGVGSLLWQQVCYKINFFWKYSFSTYRLYYLYQRNHLVNVFPQYIVFVVRIVTKDELRNMLKKKIIAQDQLISIKVDEHQETIVVNIFKIMQLKWLNHRQFSLELTLNSQTDINETRFWNINPNIILFICLFNFIHLFYLCFEYSSIKNNKENITWAKSLFWKAGCYSVTDCSDNALLHTPSISKALSY